MDCPPGQKKGAVVERWPFLIRGSTVFDKTTESS